MYGEIREIPLTAGGPLPDLPDIPCHVLILGRGDVDPVWRWQLAQRIAGSGAVLMAAFGPGTTAWDDAVDWAVIAEEEAGRRSRDSFLMTTWHDREQIEDTAAYLLSMRRSAESGADLLVILDLGGADATPEAVRRALADLGSC